MEVVGVAVAATAILLAVLAWRLSSGPVSISFLNAIIEQAASSSLQGGSLDIDDTVLIWSADERDLSLRLVDVHLMGADGNTVANVPQLAFQLSLPALFRGILAPTSIDFYGVTATILRRPDTGVTLALAAEGKEAPPDPEAAAFVGRLIEALATGGDTGAALSYLTRVGIREATLRFVDEVNGVAFDAPSARLVVYRGDGGLAGLLSADVIIGDTTAHIEMNGLMPSSGEAARIEATATNVVPAAFARMSPAFSDYALVDAPVEARGTLSIRPDGTMLSARLTLVAGEGEIALPEPWNTTIPLEKALAEVTFDGPARRIELSTLELQAGPHYASITGNLVYRQSDGLNIAGATVDLEAEDIHTEVPGFFVGPVDLEKLRVKGDIDFDALTARLDELFIGVADGGGIVLSGEVQQAERSPAVKVSGRFEPMAFDSLTAIWPLPLAKGAREWVGKNLSGGDITSGSFDVDLPAGMIADAADRIEIPKQNLRFEFAVSGATMKYLGELPPMRNLEARGLIEGDRFDAWVPSAVIQQEGLGDIAVTAGHFYNDDLHVKGSSGYITFTAEGATADILSLLDHEPLGLIGRFGLDPRSIGGTGRLTGNIDLPLVKDVTMDQVNFSGAAHAENVAIPTIQDNLSITGGTLDIDVTREGLAAKGPVSINGAPPLDLEWREAFRPDVTPGSSYRLKGVLDDDGRDALGLRLGAFLAGPANVDATFTGDGKEVNKASVKAELTDAIVKLDYAGWWKPAGTPASADLKLAFLRGGGYRISDFRLAGNDIEAGGTLTLNAEGRLAEADLPVVKLGPDNDFSFRAGPADDAALAMEVRGARFDARKLLADMFSGSRNGVDDGEVEVVPAEAPSLMTPEAVADPARRSTVSARIGHARGNNDTAFTDVRADVVQVDERTWTMSVSAVDHGGTPITVDIGPKPDGPRTLAVASSDAGSIFRALDFTSSLRGGALSATGVYDDTQPGSPIKGTVTIDNFRIVDAPVLANILTVGSLTGISDTLSGEGILFNKLELPFSTTETRINVEEARMSGPAIGLTMKGQVDRAADLVDLDGTLVPAYTINSFLGGVPVLGPLIVGREGEGIFALTYSVRGKSDDPTVVVNPLSAIAPGFLRRLFEFGSTLPPEKPASTSVAPEPAGDGVAPPIAPSAPDETESATPAEVPSPGNAAPASPDEPVSPAPQN